MRCSKVKTLRTRAVMYRLSANRGKSSSPGSPPRPNRWICPSRRSTSTFSWNMAFLDGKSITTSPGSKSRSRARSSSIARLCGELLATQSSTCLPVRSAAFNSNALLGSRRWRSAGNHRVPIRSAASPSASCARRLISCKSSSSVGPTSS